MNVDSVAVTHAKPKAYRVILLSGLTAGTLDILAAFIQTTLRGANPVRVLYAIASGWLGSGATKGGFPIAALGLISHYFIATSAAAVYYAASRKFKTLVEQPVVCGLAYGIAVWLVMNLIVLPLSAIQFKPPHTFSAVTTAVLILMFCVGLPIGLIVRRYSK